jgi:hypothetical protein
MCHLVLSPLSFDLYFVTTLYAFQLAFRNVAKRRKALHVVFATAQIDSETADIRHMQKQPRQLASRLLRTTDPVFKTRLPIQQQNDKLSQGTVALALHLEKRERNRHKKAGKYENKKSPLIDSRNTDDRFYVRLRRGSGISGH